MTCWMLSVVGALAVLPVLPALAQTPAGGLLLKTRDLNRALSEFADWSQPLALPDGEFTYNRVQVCQKRVPGVPKANPQDCYFLFWAKGSQGQPGYVKPIGATDGVDWSTVNSWFRVDRKWNRRLIGRLMLWAPMDNGGSSQSEPSPAETWRPPIPGNRWEDPRWEERKN